MAASPTTQTLKFKVVTPEKVVYEGEILQASIPTPSGEITVLPKHAPLITILSAGELRLVDKNGDLAMAVAGGFVEVKGGKEVVVLADHAERAHEIDIERAEKAKKEAEEHMRRAREGKGGDNIDFAKLQAVIERELNRIKVAKKYKKLPRARQ